MEGLAVLLRPIVFVIRTVNHALTAIPVIDDLESRMINRWFPPVVVRRVVRPTDPDLHAALALYEERLAGDLRFEAADIIRWLAEDERNAIAGDSAPRDYFLVAKFKRKVRAFVLFHYYPGKRVAFVAYMVVERKASGLKSDELSQALVSKVADLLSHDKLLRNCQTLLFEAEDPRKAQPAKQLHDIARIQRFCALAATQKFSLQAFEIDYLQPALAVPEAGASQEQPLLLLSARIRKESGSAAIQNELREALDFIYFDLYPEGFSDIFEEQNAYREYCRNLHERVVSQLPAKIKVINPIHLTCGRAVRKASTRMKRAAPPNPF